MYCGTNKTALASQRQLADAMMRLIAQKPYAQISVSELCKAAGISRQTFYTLFTSRENVVVFTLRAGDFDAPEMDSVEKECGGSMPLTLLCRAYSEYLLKNRDLIKLLVDNHIDYLLYDSFFESMDQCLCFLPQADPCTRSYAASFYAGGIACVARRYAQEGCSATLEGLQALLHTLLSGGLF